ncbi:hypothetical protein OSH93_24925 [Mycobacterium ulcerans]|uniref:hypothetical protein n=1 Tax=Mycobacterium ulcerans TaxID=1809 RepID=UPI0012DED344|nr:hypothetical protein [Mycobacterium ulcerans]MEB3971334.1 hypothetical protein [Mycobacterium ulcerans]MEB3979602.1 hypothetical protein [Mycobacterium ulcerans]MEB4008863.1 hypothetical protein [Mycobacterium ulcerans]MEB4418435.1 hypothetical protein [Mycobacterium ulcerans]MEB4436585.1 hypothetical protein [Mycobacterium ulcerans]
MTDAAATYSHPLPATRCLSTGRLSRVVVGIAAGVTLIASALAYADAGETTGPSYRLGYDKAVKDGRFTISRMQAMGFPADSIIVSGQVHKVCTNQLAAVQQVRDVYAPDFLRGCASGVQTLVNAGIPS